MLLLLFQHSTNDKRQFEHQVHMGWRVAPECGCPINVHSTGTARKLVMIQEISHLLIIHLFIRNLDRDLVLNAS